MSLDETKSARVEYELSRISDKHREVYKDTFKLIGRSKVRNGTNILLRLFSETPQYKDIWPQFRPIPDSSLMNSEVLRKHAHTYMGGLKRIIDSHDQDKLEAELKRIAQSHVKWGIYKAHLMDMLPCLLAVLSQYTDLNDDIKDAWATLFDVIANMIDIFRD
uniref:GLOBIN domain-containing protein n=1 Tax=Bursaphelenchus xylophilus TaxID=6326 RepID=A0A1I7S4C3_BURXY